MALIPREGKVVTLLHNPDQDGPPGQYHIRWPADEVWDRHERERTQISFKVKQQEVEARVLHEMDKSFVKKHLVGVTDVFFEDENGEVKPLGPDTAGENWKDLIPGVWLRDLASAFHGGNVEKGGEEKNS